MKRRNGIAKRTFIIVALAALVALAGCDYVTGAWSDYRYIGLSERQLAEWEAWGRVEVDTVEQAAVLSSIPLKVPSYIPDGYEAGEFIVVDYFRWTEYRNRTQGAQLPLPSPNTMIVGVAYSETSPEYYIGITQTQYPPPDEILWEEMVVCGHPVQFYSYTFSTQSLLFYKWLDQGVWFYIESTAFWNETEIENMICSMINQD